MILHKNNNNRYAARQGAVGEYVKRDISIDICFVYIDILHILVAACPHFVTPLPLLFFLFFFRIYYDFSVQVENVINFSPSTLTQKSFYDLPFLLCRRVAHFRPNSISNFAL